MSRALRVGERALATMTSPRRLAVSKIALGAVLVVLLGAAELGLRVSRYGRTRAVLGAWSSAPPWERLRVLGPTGDPEPRPGGDAAWALAPGEPVIRYRLNSLGLREEREVETRSARGVCRILAVGDAYTFGYGVAVDDAWPQQLARRGRSEVLNAGFPNMNVEQQRRRLRALLPRLHPDVVVVTFDWWNVPAEDAKGAEPPPRWSRAWWIANLEERAAPLGTRIALVHEALRLTRQAFAGSLFPPSGLARELEPLTLPPSALARRWERTRVALAGMAADARAAGSRFVLVLTPLDVQVDPHRNALYRSGRLAYPSHGFADVDYRAARTMPDALQRFAAGAGIPLLDLEPAFARHGGARLFLARDYHVAPAGHRLIAREVGGWVERNRPCGAPS